MWMCLRVCVSGKQTFMLFVAHCDHKLIAMLGGDKWGLSRIIPTDFLLI